MATLNYGTVAIRCTADQDCRRIAIKKGLCGAHYRRAWRANNPEKVEGERQKTFAKRLANPQVYRDRAKRHYREHKDRLNKRNSIWVRTLSGRFMVAKRNAPRAGHVWDLSFEQYSNLLSNPICSYCGGPLSATGSGLDRLDNSRGYEIGNVVPCCKECNMFRGDRLTPDESRHLIAELKRIRGTTTAWGVIVTSSTIILKD